MIVNIAINDRNAPKINRLIDSIEGSLKVRTLSYDDITEFCKKAEDALDIPLKSMIGTEIFVDVNAGKLDAYNGSPLSTQFRAKKTPAGWRLTELLRDYCWKTESRGIIFPSEKAKNAIISKFITLE